MKIAAFASRNAKEILRDPLSYIFCLGFPVIMLIIMTFVNESIPAEAGMDIFNIENLAPSIAVFGFTFVMLFTAILISKDRSTMFLARLCGTPLRPMEFFVGYILPVFFIAVMQALITYFAAEIIALATGNSLDIGGVLLSMLLLLPSALLFIGVGAILGTLFSERAAPGICSLLITVASILGGIWMDIEAVGGALFAVSRAMPFYWSVQVGQAAVAGDLGAAFGNGLVPIVYCLAVFACGAKLMCLKLLTSDVK